MEKNNLLFNDIIIGIITSFSNLYTRLQACYLEAYIYLFSSNHLFI